MTEARAILFRTGLFRTGVLVLVALSLGLAAPDAADGDADDEVIKLKAAFLRTMSRYVEWPAGTFADDKAPLVIGVIGADPFGSILDQSVRGESAKGHPFEILRIQTLPAADAPAARLDAGARELRRCHVLFVCESERTRVDRIRTMLQGSHVLTVSDIRNFARDGGAIQLVLEKDKVRFHVNRRTAERAELRIHSKLMSLATKVYDDDR